MSAHRFPCAVAGCEDLPTVVEQDEKWTVVECAAHEARTRHETSPREVAPLQLMKPTWRNYGISGRNK